MHSSCFSYLLFQPNADDDNNCAEDSRHEDSADNNDHYKLNTSARTAYSQL